MKKQLRRTVSTASLNWYRKSEYLSELPECPSNPTLDEIHRLIVGESLLNPSLEELDRMKNLNPNNVPLAYDWDVDEEANEKDSLINSLSCLGEVGIVE